MERPPPAQNVESLLEHRAWVRSMARQLAGNAFDADDLEQDAWVAAMRAQPQDGAGIRAWFVSVLRNRRRNVHRETSRRDARESGSARDEGTRSTAEIVAEADAHRRVVDAVFALADPHREALLLRYFEGLPPREIAARTGVPVETVRTRLKRAQELLRIALGGGRDEGDAWLGALAPLLIERRVAPVSPWMSPLVHVGGGLAMQTTTKIVLGVVFLAAAGAAVWTLTRDSAGTSPGISDVARMDDPPNEQPSAAKPPAAPRHATPKLEETPRPADDLPPPVDLDRADRDLDLHGTVVDVDGKGVAGARVSTVTYPWRVGNLLNTRDRDVEVAGPATRSARDGTFALRLARGDVVNLRVTADGFAPVELPSVLAGERVRVTVRPGVRLVVVLTDSTDAPVEGARVRLFNNNSGGGPAIAVRGVSRADGIATFESLPPGAWLYVAPEHPKGYAGWTKVDLPASGEKRQEIKIPASRTITGTVIDATTRNAIAGARVGMNWTLDMPVTTKEDGRFELPGWTGSGVEDIQVLAEGYAREGKNVGSAERLDFELQRGYAMTGRVVATDGKPVSGALVSFIASETSRQEQRISHGAATSDAEGQFRVTSLRIGMRHVVVVMASGFARLRRAVPVATSADDVPLGEVVLAAPRRVEGVVVAADGAPKARVPVTLSGPLGDAAAALATFYGGAVSGFTDDLGRFRFADVAPGKYSVYSRAPGVPETKADVTVAADADLLGVKLVRDATRDITVMVVDSAGEPLGGTYLRLSDRTGKSVQSRTDATGVGRVSVSASGTIQLSVHPSSDAPAKYLQFTPRDLREDESSVRVVMEIGAELTGRVVDPDGVPVAGAGLRFKVPGDAKPFASTKDDGTFRVTVPSNGRTTLDFDGVVQRSNKIEDSGLTAHLEDIAPGADLIVRCERVARDRSIVVIVVSPADTPVEGATVSVWSAGGLRTHAKTDAKGRAAFEGLPARELTISAGVQKSEYLPPSPVQAVPQGQELRLSCHAATAITGQAVNESGAALTKGMVQAWRDGKPVAYGVIDREGRFSLLLPADDVTPVRLHVNPEPGAEPGPIVLDGVVPGTQDVRLVVK